MGDPVGGRDAPIIKYTYFIKYRYLHPIQHFPSVDHWRKQALSASAPLDCDISQWRIDESL